MSVPKEIKFSGNVYIKYIDNEKIDQSILGDIMLYLNDDATSPTPGNYDCLKTSGYIKAQIFDGKFWKQIDMNEFCPGREHKFSKKEKSIETAYLCSDILQQQTNIILYKTYRDHYTIHKYEQNEYIRHKSRRK